MVNDNKHILDRIAAGTEPAEAERSALQSAAAPAAPQRSRLLAQALNAAEAAASSPDANKEHHMNWISRILSGHSGSARLGIAAAIALCALTAVAIMATFPSSPGFAATDGFALQYSGTLSDDAELKRLADAVQAEVKLIKEEYAKTDASVLEEKNIVMRIEASHDAAGGPQQWQIVIGLIGENEGLLKALQNGLSNVAGLGTGTVVPNTWFGPEGGEMGGEGINLTINAGGEERQFNFPQSASEEEIEETLRAWMAEKHPGEDFDVDVEIERDGEQVKISVQVHGPEKP